MTRRTMLWTGVSALAAACALGAFVTVVLGGVPGGFDEWWRDLMVDSRPEALLGFSYVMNRIGGGWIAIYLVPLGVAAVLLIARRWRSAVFALAAFAGSAVLVQALKHVFGRARPEEMLVLSDFGSFPSGHTANAATIALVLWLLFPRVWTAILGLLWVVAMAVSRTVLSVHWASDTLGGALVGAAAALLIGAALLPWVRGRATTAEAALDAPRESPKETAVSTIRPYRPEDRPALYDVCLRTADAGADATGIFRDDALWGDLFAVPYAERHPDLAWVVEAEDGRVIGYLVATDDTEAFEQWFRDEWWPRLAERHPRPTDPQSREERMVEYGYLRGPGREPNAAEYPAHLHIDLLPETQGQGLGRRLIATLFDELARRGVQGLHLGMDPKNTGAAAFYERLGMTPLPTAPGGQSFGVRFGD